MNIKHLILPVIALGLMAGACSKKPSSVVEEVYNSANEQKFSNILPYILPDSLKEFSDAEKEMFNGYLNNIFFSDGKIYNSFEIECENPEKDAEIVKFVVNTSLSDGMTYKEEGTLKKDKNGKWKLALVKAPNDTADLYSVSNPDKKTKELMRCLRYAYVMTLANRGLPEYQVEAADYYYYGVWVKKDYKKYFEMIDNAADKGYPKALYFVGYAYDNGEGVNQSKSKAFEYYKKAAEAGYARAMSNVGDMYLNGEGTVKDYKEAMDWYKKAIDAGYSDALTNIGYMYYMGYGVDKDQVKANEYYLEAAEAGEEYAMNNLGLNYKNGEGVDKDINKALEWFTKSADKGNLYAMTNIGDIYYNGTGGIERDYDKAFYWYSKAAEEGNTYGEYMVGACYEFGRGTDKDRTMAKKYYSLAKSKGYEPANRAWYRLL